MYSVTRIKRRTWTIGARLTFWGAGLTLAVSTLLCVILYAGMFFSLRREIDTFLEGEVYEFMLTVNAHPDDDAALERAIREELSTRARKDLSFQLFDAAGRLVASSEPNAALAGLGVPRPEAPERMGYFRFATFQPPNDPVPVRTCSLHTKTLTGREVTAQAAYRMDQMVVSLSMLQRTCLLALAVAVVLALLAGRLLATRCLQPIQGVAAAAERIRAGTLGQRIPLTGTGDELDRLAGTLNNMLERIDHYVRQVQRFTADASHELRTPLAALRGSAEVALSRERSAEELREVLEQTIEHYNRLQRIAEDLLLLARADAGENILHRERLLLNDAVADVVDLYGPLAEDRKLELRLHVGEAIWIDADGGRLKQLVGNLLDNAIKYTPPCGQITVELKTRNGLAEIVVADTGIGIPPEDLPRVFDRFYRVDRSRASQHSGGAGLGLSICRSIAEAHGGGIETQSSPGSGTRFVVALPLTSAPA